MLDHAEILFEDMHLMLGKLKKPIYEKNMSVFRERHGAYLEEMTGELEGSEEREESAKKLAEAFTDQVKEAFSVKGKINPRTQVDLNVFMIYYVFPAILLTESECAALLADHIRDAWQVKFKDSKIQYAGYKEIYDGFRDKIFGMF